MATARARAGETVAQLRDRILTELASSGVDPAALAGLLGWGISSQPGVDDDVLIGGLSPEQVTEADAPVYPENWEFLGDEIVAFFVLDIKGVVDIDGSSVAEDAASEVPAAGEVVILRDGRIVAEATSTSVVGEGDRVVVY
ncbi:MAG: hypothetical protein KIH62_004160 [Candidatus Kerfeldbacteria bacterium]|nr:hypothetical protein [Candidatus Kerfeldbacteria bacterium]